MKKLFIVLLLTLATVGFVSAQSYGSTNTATDTASDVSNVLSDSVIVTGQVSKKLSISLEDAYFNIGEIGPGATAAGTSINFGNVTIRSNVKNWSLKVKSTNGGLLGSKTSDSTTDSDTIYYTLDITGLPTVAASTALLPNLFDVVAEEVLLTMNEKTDGEEPYAMTIDLTDESANGFASANWLSTTYQDTLTFTIAAL